MINKKKITLLLASFLFVLISCDHEDHEELLTKEISKIETSYIKGSIPTEVTNGPKVETKAPEWYIEDLYENLYNEIDALMSARSNGRTATAGDYDIGLIVDNHASCPGEKITFHMDNENNSPATSASTSSGGTNFPWDIYTAGVDGWMGDLTLTFCRVDGEYYTNWIGRRYPGRHAVLRLGPLNLPGAGSVIRYFDNEDASNHNSHSGEIAPNIRNANTTLYFSFLSTSSNPQQWPWSGLGVFATRNDTYGEAYNYFIDDEDNNNANYWVINGNKQSSWNDAIMSGGLNTGFNILMFY